MSANLIPPAIGAFIQFAIKLCQGIIAKGTQVPITLVTAPAMQAHIDACATAEDNFGIARQAVKDAYAILNPANKDLLGWLNTARPMLVTHFGYRWSADWAAAGFVNNSTAIPRRITDRLAVARAIIAFLTLNPTFEMPAIGLTAANGDYLRGAVQDAQQTVNDKEQALKDSNDLIRQPARDALLTDVRAVIKNLGGKLKPNNPLWLAFGLEMPATNTTPGKPAGLIAQPDLTTGAIILTCDPLPYGERFRWRGREAGSGLPYQLIARSAGSTARTKPFMAGMTLEIMVQAVNGSSQSVPSDPILYTVPVSAAPSTTGAPTLAPLAAIPPNGNGHSHPNGKGHAHRAAARRS